MDEIEGWEPRRHRVSPRRVGIAAAAGLGITLGAAGIAAAASDPSPAPSGGASSQVAPAPPGAPGDRHGPGRHGGRGFGLRGGLHGEFVVPDGTGFRTVEVQRGEVMAVSSTSLTVKSADNYSKTYDITAKTLVNAGRDGISSVKVGEKVAVLATVKAGTATADDVRDLTQIQEQRRQWGPPPGAPGAPGGPRGHRMHGGPGGTGPGGTAPGGAAPNGTPASPSSYGVEGDATGA